MTATPLVTIVVPSFQRGPLLAACLDAIESTVDVSHEAIVVAVEGDAATHDAAAGRPHVTTVTQPTRGGYVQAANLGWRAGRGTYVTVLNDDCRLLPHSIANGIRFLETPAHAGIGQVAFFHDTPLARNVAAQIEVEGVRYAVAHVRGLVYANFGLARRDLYERLDGYDERFFMYGGDPDFSLRVWHEAALAVAPCPGALVHHAEHADPRAGDERTRQHDEDNLRLFEKWGFTARPRDPATMNPS